MLSSTALLAVLFAQLFALSAARDLWLPNLPQCWQSCFVNTGDGCSSSTCVCVTAANSVSYLPGAVRCAVAQCDADHSRLDLALGTLELLCFGIQARIPKHVMDDAYGAAADADDDDDEPSQTTPAPTATATSKQKTSKSSSAAAEVATTVRSVLTKTTTDKSAQTSTSTSVSLATSPIPEASLPSLILLPSSTSAAAARRTGTSSAGGNGSPFDTPAGGASRSTGPGLLLAMGALALLYMRT